MDHLFVSSNSDPKAELRSFDGFVNQTIVERLRHVVLLGFGMLDELQRIGHRLFRNSQGRGESLSKVFKAALQGGIIVDSGIFSQRTLGGVCAFSREQVVRDWCLSSG